MDSLSLVLPLLWVQITEHVTGCEESPLSGSVLSSIGLVSLPTFPLSL